MFGLDKNLKNDIEINFLWREGEYSLLRKKIKNKKFNSIRIRNKVIIDMDKEFAKTHCTIIAYTKLDEYLKLIPHSAIESLAAGKPLLVSSETGISEIVKKECCGIVFKPKVKELLKAIEELKGNYQRYQKNCFKTFKKYFSTEIFMRRYLKIYQELDPSIK